MSITKTIINDCEVNFLKNIEIRNSAKEHNVKLWEIADEYGMTDSGFSRKLRYELPEKEKEKILQIIKDLAAEKEE